MVITSTDNHYKGIFFQKIYLIQTTDPSLKSFNVIKLVFLK